MDHIEWLARITKGDSARGIGRTAGISFRTIADQIERGRISAENVIAVAIGYGAHPVTALVECGYIPANYAAEADPVAALRTVSEDDLAEEVLWRMKLVGDHCVLTAPIDELLADAVESGDTCESGADESPAARTRRRLRRQPSEERQD